MEAWPDHRLYEAILRTRPIAKLSPATRDGLSFALALLPCKFGWLGPVEVRQTRKAAAKAPIPKLLAA